MAAIWRQSNLSLLMRNPAFRNCYRNAYVVLLPEVPPDNPETNALLRTNELVDYKSLTAEICFNAISKLSLDMETGIWKLERELSEPGANVTFQSLMESLEKLSAPLDTVWGVAKTLYVTDSQVMPSEVYHKIHSRAFKARSMKYQSKPIYEACKKLASESKNIEPIQKRLLDKFLLEGRLNGSELNALTMTQYTETARKLEEHKNKYQRKVDEATIRFSHLIKDPNAVRAFPSDLLRATAVDSSAPSRGPWKVTLQPHIYSSFMEHCPDETLRWNVWQAFISRCSGYQDQALSTSVEIEEVRMHRRDQAKYLGYSTFASMSMETKMAASVENVNKMINVLLEKAFPAQEQELKSLKAFATERGFDGQLNPWDVPYWRRKQTSSLYSQIEEGEIREYFPLTRVLSGLTSLLADVFDVHLKLVEEHPNSWHKDASLYTVSNSEGKLLGHLYFDPYSRIGRKIFSREEVSWMLGIRSRSDSTGQTPVAAVVLNLSPALHGIPSLLSFSQVRTLLNKTGHALQHLLTQSPYSELAGQNNLEWDAVQVCSQFFQLWLTDPLAMSKISGHFESGEPLAKETLDQLNRSYVHMSGTDLCHQLYLSALDLEIYSTKDYWLDVAKRLWPRFHSFPLDKKDSHLCHFTEIISQNMSAAYYSHVWSRMVAADVFSAFVEVGPNNFKQLGSRFNKTILGHGGSVHPGETFRQFRGRDPSPGALLKHLHLN